jgi:hypothetical protein
VLATAKIISYEDLVEARAKRAEQDAAKEAKGKGKRGRKRKAPSTPEPAEDNTKVKRGRKRSRTATESEVNSNQGSKQVRMNKVLEPARHLVK